MKMNKKNRLELENILLSMSTAQQFIDNEKVVVCYKSRNTTTEEYVNIKTGSALNPITKEIGSELVYLKTAIASLTNFLAQSKC